MRWLQVSSISTAGVPLLMVATLVTAAIWPITMVWLGVGLAQGRWFADLYSLLATSDAFAMGLDPYRPNPLDPLHAPHWYTDWWFWLHDFGLTRDDAFWLGLLGNTIFVVAVIVLLRPVSGREALAGWLLVGSPAVLLGFNRANPDLVIVALFALTAGLLSSRHRPLWLLAPPVIALLTGMKFYPLVGCVALVFVRRPMREIIGSLAFMVVLGGLVGASIVDDFIRVAPLIEHELGVFTFGGGQLLRLLGCPPDAVAFVVVGLGLGVAIGATWRNAPAPPVFPEREVIAFVLGASVLLGCFWLGVSYLYRLAFAVLMLPLLWRWGRSRNGEVNRLWAKAAFGLILALAWLDGLVCLALNLGWSAGLDWTVAEFERGTLWLFHSVAWGWAFCASRLLVALGWRRWQDHQAEVSPQPSFAAVRSISEDQLASDPSVAASTSEAERRKSKIE